MELSVKGPILVGVATLLLLTSCSRVEPESTQIRVLVDGEALRKDAAYYAKDQNVSLDEAVRRLELQDDIGKLSAKLESNEPNTFGGLWIQHKPEFKVVVNMTGSAEKVAEYARGTPFAKLVQVRKVAKALKQLEAEQRQADSAVRALGLPSESGINIFKNAAELYVLDEEELNAASNARTTINIPTGVNVTEVPTFSSDEINAYAGNALSTCTAGYTVVDGNGLRGITTAAHCRPGPTSDDNRPQYYGSTALRLATEWWSGAQDFQWHTSPSLTFQPWARDDEPNSGGTRYYREIYDVANRPDQPFNALVCKYGKGSGHTCGYIVDKSYNPRGFSPRNNSRTFIRVDGRGLDLSTGGDSGGPWYVGHQAMGLHKGGLSDGDSVYMAINYVTDTSLRLLFAPR